MNENNNRMSSSYEQLEIVKAGDIEGLVEQCLASDVNLLIYGEPGCGKSSIIESLAKQQDYYLVQLGCASLCEEMINGIPVRDTATNKVTYAMPEWLDRILKNHKEHPEKAQILFLDELTLAAPEVMNSIQILLTAGLIPTHPENPLPDNVVIVSATNTAEDSNEGTELSRPLKTRFMSVRMTNSPAEYRAYLNTIVDEKLSNIKSVLGDRTERFLDDVIKDLSEYWCDDTKFYGTNPRTIMNFLKMCNYVAGTKGELTPEEVSTISKRTTGHRLVTTSWVSAEATEKAIREASIKASSTIIPDDSIMEKMSGVELENLRNTIEKSKVANTKAGIEALIKISVRIKRINEGRE